MAEKFCENKYGLPPLVALKRGETVEWVQQKQRDFELLGYFLSCHLAIEHYMDSWLQTTHPQLKWSEAKLNFGQKAALLRDLWKTIPKYDSMPAIKHMNSVRNRMSHRVDYELTDADLLPLRQFLDKVSSNGQVPEDRIAMLSHFTSMACVTFASQISYATEKSPIERPLGD